MTSIAYINGDFVNATDAKISIFDRGVLFGDSVYEVIPVYDGHPYFVDKHLRRLNNSLSKTKINTPGLDWSAVFDELIERNGGGNLQLYLQITRGNQGKRQHDIPEHIEPSCFAFTLHASYPTMREKQRGLHATIIEDFRWLHCDIKATSLLANILLNDEAVSRGYHTALLSRDGFLTEGSASNVFIVDTEGIIKTPPLNHFCLPGITREIVIDLIKELGLPFAEEPIPIPELFNAKEIWITSTTKEIHPISQVNHRPVSTGDSQAYWQQLNQQYHQLIGNSHE